jgi:hypothetical protein
LVSCPPEPIVYWFRPTAVPAGSAPLNIREAWVGVPMPVRQARPVEGPQLHIGRDVADRRMLTVLADGVPVATADAIGALRLCGQPEAAAWWEGLVARRPATVAMLFRRGEGELLPPRLAQMLYPDATDHFA